MCDLFFVFLSCSHAHAHHIYISIRPQVQINYELVESRSGGFGGEMLVRRCRRCRKHFFLSLSLSSFPLFTSLSLFLSMENTFTPCKIVFGQSENLSHILHIMLCNGDGEVNKCRNFPCVSTAHARTNCARFEQSRQLVSFV